MALRATKGDEDSSGAGFSLRGTSVPLPRGRAEARRRL